ncbi:Fe2+-dependent dioxygenase [Prochlorococcus sp. AH-716-M06]|nr:Fe2+-dependent dioxygenase [Prochlorococcus sp. AH-716-M06]
MNYLTRQLLNAEEINFIEKELEKENQGWEDGKKTAGSQASIIKNNLQLKRKSDISKKLSSLVRQKILNDDLIKSFTLPKIIHGIMFTKSSKGMKYGRHIDNAYMSSGRADLSFTIFLTKKNLYKGGELLIEDLTSENKFKLNSGEILIYPSTYLHSVQEVLNGERIVCVGWIESYIKSIEEREYLFDLDAGARSLLAKHGRSDDLDLIFKSYSNLLRIMGD